MRKARLYIRKHSDMIWQYIFTFRGRDEADGMRLYNGIYYPINFNNTDIRIDWV